MRARDVIVVGLDGSSGARRALDWAIAEARARHCVVHVVHAWTSGAMTDFTWRPRRALRADSIALLKAAISDSTSDGVEVWWSSVEGEPVRALLDAAADASLLVLAAHRGPSLRGRVLGTVTRSCLRQSPVPVAVVPPSGRVHRVTGPRSAGSGTLDSVAPTRGDRSCG